ncbi:enterobactin synthetase component F [Salmonella enterica subsp. enterica]|nr:enterobactin synthetase component F [Salmonella enterica subsp. enterica]
MTQRLPLVAAQPGIWMAEKLSDLPLRLERGALRGTEWRAGMPPCWQKR